MDVRNRGDSADGVDVTTDMEGSKVASGAEIGDGQPSQVLAAEASEDNTQVASAAQGSESEIVPGSEEATDLEGNMENPPSDKTAAKVAEEDSQVPATLEAVAAEVSPAEDSTEVAELASVQAPCKNETQDLEVATELEVNTGDPPTSSEMAAEIVLENSQAPQALDAGLEISEDTTTSEATTSETTAPEAATEISQDTTAPEAATMEISQDTTAPEATTTEISQYTATPEATTTEIDQDATAAEAATTEISHTTTPEATTMEISQDAIAPEATTMEISQDATTAEAATTEISQDATPPEAATTEISQDTAPEATTTEISQDATAAEATTTEISQDATPEAATSDTTTPEARNTEVSPPEASEDNAEAVGLADAQVPSKDETEDLAVTSSAQDATDLKGSTEENSPTYLEQATDGDGQHSVGASPQVSMETNDGFSTSETNVDSKLPDEGCTIVCEEIKYEESVELRNKKEEIQEKLRVIKQTQEQIEGGIQGLQISKRLHSRAVQEGVHELQEFILQHYKEYTRTKSAEIDEAVATATKYLVTGEKYAASLQKALADLDTFKELSTEKQMEKIEEIDIPEVPIFDQCEVFRQSFGHVPYDVIQKALEKEMAVEEVTPANFIHFTPFGVKEGYECDVLILTPWMPNKPTFYVMPTDNFNITEAQELSSLVRTTYLKENSWKTFHDMGTVPEVGQMVFVYADFLNLWCRGKVQDITDKDVDVFLLDDGIVESFRTDAILPFRSDLCNADEVGVHCSFECILEAEKNPEMQNKITEVRWYFNGSLVDASMQGVPVLCKFIRQVDHDGEPIWYVHMTSNGTDYTEVISQQIKDHSMKSGPIVSRDIRKNVEVVKANEGRKEADADQELQEFAKFFCQEVIMGVVQSLVEEGFLTEEKDSPASDVNGDEELKLDDNHEPDIDDNHRSDLDDNHEITTDNLGNYEAVKCEAFEEYFDVMEVDLSISCDSEELLASVGPETEVTLRPGEDLEEGLLKSDEDIETSLRPLSSDDTEEALLPLSGGKTEEALLPLSGDNTEETVLISGGNFVKEVLPTTSDDVEKDLLPASGDATGELPPGSGFETEPSSPHVGGELGAVSPPNSGNDTEKALLVSDIETGTLLDSGLAESALPRHGSVEEKAVLPEPGGEIKAVSPSFDANDMVVGEESKKMVKNDLGTEGQLQVDKQNVKSIKILKRLPEKSRLTIELDQPGSGSPSATPKSVLSPNAKEFVPRGMCVSPLPRNVAQEPLVHGASVSPTANGNVFTFQDAAVASNAQFLETKTTDKAFSPRPVTVGGPSYKLSSQKEAMSPDSKAGKHAVHQESLAGGESKVAGLIKCPHLFEDDERPASAGGLVAADRAVHGSPPHGYAFSDPGSLSPKGRRAFPKTGGHFKEPIRKTRTSGDSYRDKPFERTYSSHSRDCYTCGKPGHISRDCPNRHDRFSSNAARVQRRPPASNRPPPLNRPPLSNRGCYVCGDTQHIKRDCPKRDQEPPQSQKKKRSGKQ